MQIPSDSFNLAHEIAYSEFYRAESFRRSSKPSRFRLRSPPPIGPALNTQLGGAKRAAMEEWADCSAYKRSRSHHAKSPGGQSPVPMSP